MNTAPGRRYWSALIAACSCIVGIATAVCAAEVVHTANFDDPAAIGDEWSARQTTLPPVERRATRAARNAAKAPLVTARRFLGEFTNDTVTLTLKKLPPHEYLKISLDLLILKQWNGSQDLLATGDTAVGGESWGLQLDDGPLLVHGVFVNNPPGPGKWQTYPCLIPGERVAARTGENTKAHNSLGYANVGGDATYPIKVLIPHKAAQVKLNFFGENLSDPEESAWGIDNVSIEVLRADEVPALTEAVFKETWDNLGDSDALRAYEAAWKLIAAPDKTLAKAEKFLSATGREVDREQLTARVKMLVRQLDADEFRQRERASKELDRLGPAALPALRHALRDTPSPEVRARLEAILSRTAEAVNPVRLNEEGRRRERLGVVLGIINSPASQKLLQSYYTDR